MLQIRLFEERTQELSQQGLIGSTHLAQGQEAVSRRRRSARSREDDYMTYTYRSHAAVLARGMGMETAFAEMMGRRDRLLRRRRRHHAPRPTSTRACSVRSGSSAQACRWRSAPPTSAKLRGTTAVALGFCGDGATNIGTFHEALNMAAVWKAPVVFVIENNLYGEYSPVRETTSVEDLAVRAQRYAIPGVIVDGQVVEEVHAATAEAVERARRGDGPDADRGQDLPLPRPRVARPGQVPPGRGGRGLAGARPDRDPRREARRASARSPRTTAARLRDETQARSGRRRRTRRRGGVPDPRGDRTPMSTPADSIAPATVGHVGDDLPRGDQRRARRRACGGPDASLFMGEDVGIEGGVFKTNHGLTEKYGARARDATRRSARTGSSASRSAWR